MTSEEAIEFIAQSVKSDVDMAKVADAIKALEQESTSKNDLGVDCIDRKKLIDWINIWDITPIIKNPLIRHIQGMPSVTPQEPILDQITEIIEPLRHVPIDEMSDIEWDILRVIDKYKAETEKA